MKGSIFIVSAPSGAGKTTLCKMLIQSMPDIIHSISYTTRPPRPGEVDGKDYYFVKEDRFLEMVRKGEFLEWAEVHGNLYGTSKQKLLETINNGTDVILDIDVQGASQIRAQQIDATFIFILPPSMEVLKERLTKRQTDTEEIIQRRLQKAREEIKQYRSYDYVIINDELEVALEQLKAVVLSQRLKTEKIPHEWVEKTFQLQSLL